MLDPGMAMEDRQQTATLMCRHCQQRRVNRPRGLCYRCYYTVRAQYPSESRFGRWGVGVNAFPRLLPEPTAWPPGSAGKVQVLIERAENGLILWHPDDAKAEEEESD